jgi:hypothetical protein
MAESSAMHNLKTYEFTLKGPSPLVFDASVQRAAFEGTQSAQPVGAAATSSPLPAPQQGATPNSLTDEEVAEWIAEFDENNDGIQQNEWNNMVEYSEKNHNKPLVRSYCAVTNERMGTALTSDIARTLSRHDITWSPRETRDETALVKSAPAMTGTGSVSGQTGIQPSPTTTPTTTPADTDIDKDAGGPQEPADVDTDAPEVVTPGPTSSERDLDSRDALTLDEVKAWVGAFDRNDDGRLNFIEYVDMTSFVAQKHGIQMLRSYCAITFHQGDNALTFERLGKVMNDYGITWGKGERPDVNWGQKASSASSASLMMEDWGTTPQKYRYGAGRNAPVLPGYGPIPESDFVFAEPNYGANANSPLTQRAGVVEPVLDTRVSTQSLSSAPFGPKPAPYSYGMNNGVSHAPMRAELAPQPYSETLTPFSPSWGSGGFDFASLFQSFVNALMLRGYGSMSQDYSPQVATPFATSSMMSGTWGAYPQASLAAMPLAVMSYFNNFSDPRRSGFSFV